MNMMCTSACHADTMGNCPLHPAVAVSNAALAAAYDCGLRRAAEIVMGMGSDDATYTEIAAAIRREATKGDPR